MTKLDVTSTAAVHAGDDPARSPTTPSRHRSSRPRRYTFASTAEIVAFTPGTAAASGGSPTLLQEREEYGSYGNPTVRAVEKKLAALDGTEDAILFSSGMAAISTAILALVRAGQHVVYRVRDGYG